MTTELSANITKGLDKTTKKNNGIFFTPSVIVERNISLIRDIVDKNINILEPSFGSGEFIIQLSKSFPGSQIYGIEKNEFIFNKAIENIPQFNSFNVDFLQFEIDKKFDLIIGNPPYFTVDKKTVRKEYLPYFTGRPNIYILFIIKSIGLLTDNGIISFVLPANFMNSSYYNNLRAYINLHFKIIIIEELESLFVETKQNTVLFIIQKCNKPINDEFTIKFDNLISFNVKNKIDEIDKLLSIKHTTLNKLNCKVYVGNIVWNQHKDLLTDDNTKTRLIYNSDGKLLNINPIKKNYIDKPGGITGKLLIVNRGYGIGNYKFSFNLIDSDTEYLIENHLICIKTPDDKLYDIIINSFNNNNTKKFIKYYFSNNAISTFELANILPIYV